MCGIFGAIGRYLPEATVERVLRVLHHRGPDDRGAFVDEAAAVTLLHTRLSVLDLETGAQPLQSKDGSVTLVANGEIYDFERIRSALEEKGHRFKTRSDSEVILHLYQEHGTGCLEHLRGEFAFLLYDKAKQLFVAARDRFGIKPLYFARLYEGFVFASEMKAIFASDLVVPKLNAAAFDPLLEQDQGQVQFPFAGIEHVPPASYLRVNLKTGKAECRRYWSGEIPGDTADPVVDDEDAAAAYARSVLRELEDAVRLRLRADVPVGLYLSGGVDSAFIAALMTRNLQSPPHSFSIAFEGSDRNEQRFARRAAEFVGTEHHELVVTKQMLWDNLEQCLWHSELPFVSLAPIGKFLLSREARKYVTVVLTGEGADELFLGYRRFFEDAIRDTRAPVPARRAQSAQVRRLKFGRFAGAKFRKLSLLMFARQHRRELDLARQKAAQRPCLDRPVINAVQESRIAAMPLDILCFLGDREEMAHSLEARLPFLDHKLYELAKDIPVDFKMRRGIEKAVLRDAAKGILPDDLRLRPKSGFMLTSEAVDLFGSDRAAAAKFRSYSSKRVFEAAGVFNHRAYLLVRLLAHAPPWKRFGLRQLRRNANKALMYMMQTHMLHQMFVEDRRWAETGSTAADATKAAAPLELAD